MRITSLRQRRAVATVSGGALIVGALVLSGCTGAPASNDDATSDSPTAGISVIAIGGPLSDPFFGTLQKGGQEAAASLGATFDYTAPNDFSNGAADLARLMENAIAKKPDVIMVGNFIPPVLNDLITQASASGITIVSFNSGLESWQANGSVAFVGEDFETSGRTSGELEAEAGVTNGVCINHVPENPVLQLRCDAYVQALVDAGGTGDTLTIPSTSSGDQQAVSQAVKGYIESHPDLDGIMSLGSGIAVAVEKAIEDTGSKALLGSADLSTQTLEDVKSGKLLFAIDQQPYLQGYYGVLIGVQEVAYGIHPTAPVFTSPLVITKDNVDVVLDAQKFGVRGAS